MPQRLLDKIIFNESLLTMLYLIVLYPINSHWYAINSSVGGNIELYKLINTFMLFLYQRTSKLSYFQTTIAI